MGKEDGIELTRRPRSSYKRYLAFLLGLMVLLFIVPLIIVSVYEQMRTVRLAIVWAGRTIPISNDLIKDWRGKAVILKKEADADRQTAAPVAAMASGTRRLINEIEISDSTQRAKAKALNGEYSRLMSSYEAYLNCAPRMPYEDAWTSIALMNKSCVELQMDLVKYYSPKPWPREIMTKIPFVETMEGLFLENELRHKKWERVAEYCRNHHDWNGEVYCLRQLGAKGRARIVQRTIQRVVDDVLFEVRLYQGKTPGSE